MTERIAVIAVHGVGHHDPREAARACADMLAITGNYEPFIESPIRVPVEGLLSRMDPVVRVRPAQDEAAGKSRKRTERPVEAFLDKFDERPDFVREKENPIDPEIRYMEEQLSRYVPHGGDCVYETVTLKAKTKAAGPGGAKEVHVFDMYWTDLSRVSTAGLRMIGELYQLLFYVSGLGRHTLDFATDKYQGDKWWSALALFQRHAERLLVLWIPVLNLCAAGLVIVLLPKMLLEREVPSLAIMAFFLAVFALAGWALKRWRSPGPTWPHMFVVLVLGAILAALFGLLYPFVTLLLESWLFVGAAIVALMYVYGKRRPGALQVAIECVGAATILLAIFAVREAMGQQQPSYTAVGLAAGWWVYQALHIAWTLFFLATIAVSIAGLIVGHRHPDSLDRRTIWTANLSIALPGLMVLILNLGLWQGVLNLSKDYIDPGTFDGISKLIDMGTPWALGIIMTVGIVALLSTVWGMLPSVFGEVFSRDVGRDRVAFGRSLSGEFKLLRFWGEVLRLLVVLLPVLYLVKAGWTDDWKHFSAQMTAYVGFALVAILFGPFAQLGMGLRTAIDVAIDVANWLRLHPKEENPRAKICARYASLLRHIVACRDANGKGFDRIVIFSHSQGTVISSELLRYLRLTRDPLSQRIADTSVVLFTMGCPLRQLYSQRFPIQYGWARDEDAPRGKGVSDRPSPTELNITAWINAYRSGDYVGRELWSDDSFSSEPVAFPGTADGKGRRIDVCIGAGGHTHYWDDSARPIAEILDQAVQGGFDSCQ